MNFYKTLYFSIFMVVLYYVGVDMYSPALPAIARYFQINSDLTRWTITVFVLTFAISQLIFGMIINRYHHKKMIVLFSVIFMLGSLVCLASANISILYIGRVLQGIGASCLFAIGFATLKNNLEGVELERALPINSLMYTVFAAMAPLLGGYITAHFNWQTNFGVMFIFCLLILISILCMYHSEQIIDQAPININKTVKGYIDLCKTPMFVINSVMAVNALIALISFYTLMPFIFIKHMGGSVKLFGWFGFYFVFLTVLCRLFHLVFLRKRISSMMSVFLFSILLAIGAIMLLASSLLFKNNLVAFIVSFSLIIIGGSFVNPNCQVLTFISVTKQQAGHASVLFGFIGSLYIASASMVSASIPDNLVSLSLIMVVVAILGMVGATLNFYFSYWVK
ncbi:MFS transporter [Francisellaceae bacterium]|nr:MFS transporter [Francisellaceae bacterium]